MTVEQASEFCPFGRRVQLSENHLPEYDALRAAGPLIRNTQGWIPAMADWLATDWETVSAVFRDAELFSSARGSGTLGFDRKMVPLEVDPPEHVGYRRRLDPYFSPNRLRPLESSLRTQINDFIDAFIDAGSVDLLADFFIPYPTQVFLTMYGLPLSDRPMFLRWKDDLIRGSRLDPALGQRAGDEMYAYVRRAIADRDRDATDMLSQFVHGTSPGDQLSLDEILDITYLFLLAGLDTVTTALTHSFAYLATHPAVRRQIVDDPSIIPLAVEELIRAFTPAPALARVATRDVEIGGVTVREGESVFCHLGAANGDPKHLPNATDIDLRRAENRHSSFGLGIHRCLGSHLARMEVRPVLEEFHRRIPDYELAPGLDLYRVPFFEGLESLPVTFPPGGRRLQS